MLDRKSKMLYNGINKAKGGTFCETNSFNSDNNRYAPLGTSVADDRICRRAEIFYR